MSVKANELRLGNWIIYLRNNLVNEYQKVLTVSEYTITVNEYNQDGACYPKDISVFKPIPLTPEILEKAGFSQGNIFWKIEKDIKISVGGGRANIGSNFSTSAIFTVDVKYLHQLQNLYFALTGEELTINL